MLEEFVFQKGKGQRDMGDVSHDKLCFGIPENTARVILYLVWKKEVAFFTITNTERQEINKAEKHEHDNEGNERKTNKTGDNNVQDSKKDANVKWTNKKCVIDKRFFFWFELAHTHTSTRGRELFKCWGRRKIDTGAVELL